MADERSPARLLTNPQPIPGRGQSLIGRLILFGTLVTLVAVASSILILSVLTRRQARSHLVELLAQNQSNAKDLQERSLQELLWISALMSQSPTLRAAMDTYRSESTASGPRRADLLATVGAEVERIRALMGKDLVIVTDERGAILASAPPTGEGAGSGSSLADRSWMRQVLDPGAPESHPIFGLMAQGANRYHVGCVPIAMQGFVIGTLTIGDRVDATWFASRRGSLRSDVALITDGRVIGSTLEATSLAPALAEAPRGAAPNDTQPAATVIVSGEEFLAVPISMGPDDQGHPATLLLLQSLTRALEPMQRSFLMALVSCGALTVVLAGLAAWRISRSILVPLERFVSFVRSVATTHDASRRFEEPGLTAEVRTLNDAFTDLLDSLQERERLLMLHQREELIRMERLKESEKLASLGRMLSGAAHEINNPLTAVLGQVDLTLGDDGLSVKAKDRLEKARKEAHRISALVRNLLKVAHRDTGERRQVDLHQVLRETIDLRKHDFTAAGIALVFEPCDAPIVLQANELELQQVFLNIINNAFDALKEITGQREVAIRTSMGAGRALVTLSDNGPGMKQPGKVFDHFYTTKDIGKGTGLGLSITHAIVQNHGGTITAQNLTTGGACFTIELPQVAPPPASQARPPSTLHTLHGLPTGAQAVSVLPALHLEAALIVEDEPSVLEYQMEILRSLGASPVGARSADEAIEWLRRREFQVIISDMKMPGGKSGADLFAWVEKNLPALASRFIFVTGDTANETTRAFLEKAGRPYLMKPFELEDYVQALRDSQTLLPVA